ncbi:hypothetical protein CEH05_19870 [Halobacillus halophilus]|uniref:DUF4367 domain-containing protein n=1 Tax=Halobacillus halophilus (strain ATCC 35676 / DSM 2266 / JCM 20832 / KCTC 3685 / LMG 17431 / NBRC 102448 / NCIMB 2269) TaxID=866895 RepID=I0JTB5_HALH3|nr:hypothetical protein [Halobacillus halophilus]ASF41299.1 hypothetical protein CEH05_19870 [Halobacillus halophilus]CCG47387.1 hypothetical protein HBHAL_5052 [Halobacillus halophilus DSM 2266]
MKKLALPFILMSVFLVACSQTESEENLVEYNTEEVSRFLKHLSFNPQIPTLLPFKPEKITVSGSDRVMNNNEADYQTNDFYFHKDTKNLTTPDLSFRTSISKDLIDNTDETVELEDGTKAQFGVNNSGIKTLKWKDHKDDNIYYQLFAYKKSSISKEQLIDIANHFSHPE